MYCSTYTHRHTQSRIAASDRIFDMVDGFRFCAIGSISYNMTMVKFRVKYIFSLSPPARAWRCSRLAYQANNMKGEFYWCWTEISLWWIHFKQLNMPMSNTLMYNICVCVYIVYNTEYTTYIFIFICTVFSCVAGMLMMLIFGKIVECQTHTNTLSALESKWTISYRNVRAFCVYTRESIMPIALCCMVMFIICWFLALVSVILSVHYKCICILFYYVYMQW